MSKLIIPQLVACRGSDDSAEFDWGRDAIITHGKPGQQATSVVMFSRPEPAWKFVDCRSGENWRVRKLEFSELLPLFKRTLAESQVDYVIIDCPNDIHDRTPHRYLSFDLREAVEALEAGQKHVGEMVVTL